MKLLIIGAGCYGMVVKELAIGKYDSIDFLDDEVPFAIGKTTGMERFAGSCVIVAIGEPDIRRNLFEKAKKAGMIPITLVSDKAYVSPSAEIGEGVVIEPCAVVNANAHIGNGTFLCAGAVVNHNANVGEFCQIDCGAVVGTGAEVEMKTHLHYNQVVTTSMKSEDFKRSLCE